MSRAIDVTEDTFESDVVARSHEAPVVIDFWADWCRPCHMLGPVLEKLAEEADGAWTLAKIDVDSNQNLAAAFGIQGIPAVKAVVDGKIAAEFTGALPEQEVRRWLEQLGPTEGEATVAEGRAAESRGDTGAAIAAYELALDLEPGNLEARSSLSRLRLQERAESGGDEGELELRLESDPADVDAAVALSDLRASRGDYERAFDVLLAVVRTSAGDTRERARARLVELLDTLPADDPRALAARRALASALF
jgi:putative thioredoxin